MTEQTPILSVQGLRRVPGTPFCGTFPLPWPRGDPVRGGESGCGKSTLLRALMGADDAAEVTAGTVILAGRGADGPARRQRQRYRCRHMG